MLHSFVGESRESSSSFVAMVPLATKSHKAIGTHHVGVVLIKAHVSKRIKTGHCAESLNAILTGYILMLKNVLHTLMTIQGSKRIVDILASLHLRQRSRC